MRLAKTTDNTERIKKIQAQRLAIKEREKQILLQAKKEIRERQEAVERWHGIRLFCEVQAQEKALKEKIKQLQKETPLKKKEILASNETLKQEDEDIKAKKRLARKKSKGRSFLSSKRLLSRKIILAHNNNDLEAENRLKEELKILKRREKEYILVRFW